VHALQVAEDLAAQVEHDLLAGPLHVVGLQEFEDEGEEQQSEIDCRDLYDAGQGPWAEPIPEGRGCSLRRRQIAVNGDFYEIGADYVGNRLQDDRDDRNPDVHAIGAQVGEQPAHQAAVICFP
jgi:hypothetical protein